MGTWGVGVWQDDVARDVVLMFHAFLTAGASPAEATEHILAEPPWPLDDRDDEVVQLLALAALALQHGVPDTALRARAIAIIQSGDALDRWAEAEPEDVAARQAVVDRIEALLVRGTATDGELAAITTAR